MGSAATLTRVDRLSCPHYRWYRCINRRLIAMTPIRGRGKPKMNVAAHWKGPRCICPANRGHEPYLPIWWLHPTALLQWLEMVRAFHFLAYGSELCDYTVSIQAVCFLLRGHYGSIHRRLRRRMRLPGAAVRRSDEKDELKQAKEIYVTIKADLFEVDNAAYQASRNSGLGGKALTSN